MLAPIRTAVLLLLVILDSASRPSVWASTIRSRSVSRSPSPLRDTSPKPPGSKTLESSSAPPVTTKASNNLPPLAAGAGKPSTGGTIPPAPEGPARGRKRGGSPPSDKTQLDRKETPGTKKATLVTRPSTVGEEYVGEREGAPRGPARAASSTPPIVVAPVSSGPAPWNLTALPSLGNEYAAAMAKVREHVAGEPVRHLVMVTSLEALGRLDAQLRARLAAEHATRPWQNVLVFRYHLLGYGYAGHFSDATLALLRNLPDVTVAQEKMMRLFSAREETQVDNYAYVGDGVLEARRSSAWHLARISSRKSPVSRVARKLYTPSPRAIIFMLDSGVDKDHPMLQGLVEEDATFAAGDSMNSETHGTAVASMLVNGRLGSASNAFVRSVKVCAEATSCPTGAILQGLHWVAQYVEEHKRSSNPVLVNVSLGGEDDGILDLFVDILVANYNVPVFVAAGNDGEDACTVSPARAEKAFTVAASDASDNHAGPGWKSAWGKCVRLHAPGDDLVVARANGREITPTTTMSGTSFATALVTGVAANLMQSGKARTAEEVYALLVDLSTKGVIKNVPTSAKGNKVTTGNLLYTLPFEWKSEMVGLVDAQGA